MAWDFKRFEEETDERYRRNLYYLILQSCSAVGGQYEGRFWMANRCGRGRP